MTQSILIPKRTLANARRVATRKINILKKSGLKVDIPYEILHHRFVVKELEEKGILPYNATKLGD